MKYTSDVTDSQWEIISGNFKYGNYGNRSKYKKRELVNAVFYITKNGCHWRDLPKCFPPWQTVYSFFRRAKEKGIWEKIKNYLVEKSRVACGKKISTHL